MILIIKSICLMDYVEGATASTVFNLCPSTEILRAFLSYYLNNQFTADPKISVQNKIRKRNNRNIEGEAQKFLSNGLRASS